MNDPTQDTHHRMKFSITQRHAVAWFGLAALAAFLLWLAFLQPGHQTNLCLP